jgi:alkylation response protein AidB-like acyl-CoA dehydrogenase
MNDLAMDLQGPLGQLWDDETFEDVDGGWPMRSARSRAYSIFSGTSEVQRNIISERVLGMPRG